MNQLNFIYKSNYLKFKIIFFKIYQITKRSNSACSVSPSVSVHLFYIF